MGKMAETVFDKIYEEFVYSADGFAELNDRVDGMIKEVVKENEGRLDEQQLESLSDSFAKIVAEAQRGGYRLGLKHACRLMFGVLSD